MIVILGGNQQKGIRCSKNRLCPTSAAIPGLRAAGAMNLSPWPSYGLGKGIQALGDSRLGPKLIGVRVGHFRAWVDQAVVGER